MFGWFRRQAGDDLIDALIVAHGVDRQTGTRSHWDTADDSLRRQSEERRAQAEDKKREGRQIETRDDRRSKIHIA